MIIGKEILRYAAIDSTSSEARRLIKQGKGEGLVVVADSQTKGRGKPGSSWLSPRGNLYLSAVLKPRKNVKDLAPITLLAALAARAAIARSSGLPVLIKWPNDLRVRGKKIGGILTERIPSGHLIIGIGVNINVAPRSFTSLKAETGKTYSVARFARRVMEELGREYLAYLLKV